MTDTYIVISVERIAQFEPDIIMYKTNVIISTICMVFVVFNLIVLVSNKYFLCQYKNLVVLNATYIIVLAGILLEAISRLEKYAIIRDTKQVLKVTSKDCIELWTLVQVFADFVMPSIQFIMGLERFIAVKRPFFYRTTFNYTVKYCIIIGIIGATIATAIPATISAITPTPNVKLQCGRKAAFGTLFGIFDYAFNVAMISMALLLNIVTCLKAMAIQQSRNSMRKIKCYTGIAVVSTVLVSVPNLFSIINATWIQLPDAMMTPAPILACINCSLQFFINLCLNDEYRTRFLKIVTIGKYRSMNISSVQNESTKVGSFDMHAHTTVFSVKSKL